MKYICSKHSLDNASSNSLTIIITININLHEIIKESTLEIFSSCNRFGKFRSKKITETTKCYRFII